MLKLTIINGVCKMTRQKLILLFFAMILIVTACSCSEKETIEQPIEEEKEEVVEQEEEETFANKYPLTGIETNESVDHRIVSVMVNNQVQARPQSGLSKADIVFEILSESNITRFLALFHSEQPEVVGPVRSAREYYMNLAKDYEAIYVYHGAADFVNDLVKQSGVDFLNGSLYDNDGHLFKRESFRKAPHNSYLQFGAVNDVAESKGYSLTKSLDLSLPFIDEDDEIFGDNVAQVSIGYIGQNPGHVVQYKYNDQTEQYERYEDDAQTVELNTEEPVQVSNVFIIEADHEVIDKEGRRKINFASGGNAYLLQKGKLQQVDWINDNGQIIPVKEGAEVGFLPGKTWINVVPTDPGLEASVNFQAN